MDIEVADGDEIIAVITTPLGAVQVLGSVTRIGRILYVDRAHIHGLGPGVLGRAGLNAIARKLLEEADVDQVIIEGSVRTTGRNPGKRPRRFRFPNN